MNRELDGEPSPASTKDFEEELRAQDFAARFRSLRVAIAILRVSAVVYLVVTGYAFVKAMLNLPVTPADGYLLGIITGFLKDVISVFFTWVLADVIKLLLETKADTAHLRAKV